MTELQTKIVDLLKKDSDIMTCDDIGWELKKHKMHIGKSIKGLVDKGILRGYRPSNEDNFHYYYYFEDE